MNCTTLAYIDVEHAQLKQHMACLGMPTEAQFVALVDLIMCLEGERR